jgi:hypothetical protein
VLPLCAQVSPGPLSKAHESLEGPLKCGSCHRFGTKTPQLRCLHCHREIAALVAQKRGYHGRFYQRAKGEHDCARCHTEHYGKDFYIIRWPTSKDEFDHKLTGYPLVGGHAGLKCEQCHNASHIGPAARKLIAVKDLSRTFQGLSPACLTCHEDLHRGQLGPDCQRCHGFTHWKPVQQFDHSKTKFPLTGKHADVACAKCHKPLANDPKTIQYTGLSFAACTGCHQDPHHGAFAARCESCHNTSGWKQVRHAPSAFDHNTTKFPLRGKHASVPCLKCHKDANFKTPVAHAKCLDCHQDYHERQFARRADGGECAACHNEQGWRPATFTEARHQSAAFPLAGKHAGVPCAKCHTPAGAATNYHPAYKLCADCHKDPHGGQFAANKCEECHVVGGFRPSTFTLARHQSSRFPLEGAHAAVPCANCHKEVPDHKGRDIEFHFASLTCETCHQDPHHRSPQETWKTTKAGESPCVGCHTLTSWQDLRPFDHSATAFPLTGTHRSLTCQDCHRPAAKAAAEHVIFTDAPRQCAGCHEDIHGGQFRKGTSVAECSTCHNTARWDAASFDHNKETDFPLDGAHRQVPCQLCHLQRREINGRSVVIYKGAPRTCEGCHRK